MNKDRDAIRAATRGEVYDAIDSERDYQDSRWNASTTTTRGLHSVTEWIAYIEDYLAEAKRLLARQPSQVSVPPSLEIMRKVAGMSVACMEEHGAPQRAGFERKNR
jgi:hypothetical protein